MSDSGKKIKIMNKKYITMIMLFILSVSGFFLLYEGKIKSIVQNESYMDFISDNEESNLGELKKDTEISQTFKAKSDFKSIAIRFSTYANINQGELNARLTDLESNEVVNEWNINISELEDNAFYELKLDEPIYNCQGKEYRVDLSIKGLDEKNVITLTSSIVDLYKDGELYVDGELRNGDLCIATMSLNSNFLKYIYIAIAIVMTLFIVGVYYMIFIKKSKIENIFLVSAVCLGLTCVFLQTPYSNYDEPAHINTAYRYSNKLFRINNGIFGGALPKRAVDDYSGLTYDATNISSYKTVFDNLFSVADEADRQLVPMNVTRVREAPYIYLPSIMGVSIARVLHLGQIPLLLLGRIFNLAFFIAACYFAIKKMPFAKILLFVVALTPMNLGQSSTFSYDSVIIGLSYLFTAYCLYIAFGKEEVNKKDLITFFVITILLAPLKKVYVLICFVALIIPKSRFENIKKYRRFFIAFIGLIGVFYIFINAVEAIGIVTKQSEVAVFSQVEAYTFSDIISSPIGFVKIFINSVVHDSYEFIYCGVLSFYKVHINAMFTFIYIVLLLLSTIKTCDEEKFLNTRHKIWIGILLFVLLFGFYAAGFTWTPKGETLIQGVQGRYMLPALPFVLLMFRNNNLVLKKDINKGLMFSVAICEVMALTSLFSTIISR